MTDQPKNKIKTIFGRFCRTIKSFKRNKGSEIKLKETERKKLNRER